MRSISLTTEAITQLEEWILKCSQKLWHCYQKLQAPHLKGLVNQTLKHDLKGKWSGRINQEHSLIYEVKDDVIIVLACRYHYS